MNSRKMNQFILPKKPISIQVQHEDLDENQISSDVKIIAKNIQICANDNFRLFQNLDQHTKNCCKLICEKLEAIGYVVETTIRASKELAIIDIIDLKTSCHHKLVLKSIEYDYIDPKGLEELGSQISSSTELQLLLGTGRVSTQQRLRLPDYTLFYDRGLKNSFQYKEAACEDPVGYIRVQGILPTPTLHFFPRDCCPTDTVL